MFDDRAWHQAEQNMLDSIEGAQVPRVVGKKLVLKMTADEAWHERMRNIAAREYQRTGNEALYE